MNDATDFLLRESLEMLYFCLFFSTPPFWPKALHGSQLFELYSRQRLHNRTASLCRKGYIRKIKAKKLQFSFNKDRRYSFLSDAIDIKAQQFQKKWDKKWRLVIYDIPERSKKHREWLRHNLQALGFGMIQDSCWASCYDYTHQINHRCREYGLLKYLCIYEGNFFAGKNIDEIADRAWNLQNLDSRYDKLIESCNDYTRIIETNEVNFKEYYLKGGELFHEFNQLLVKDPFLPKDFSGLWRKRVEAERLIARLPQKLFSTCNIRL